MKKTLSSLASLLLFASYAFSQTYLPIASNGVSIEVSNSNLNNLTSVGFYRGHTLSNAPDLGWWYITVEAHDNTNGNNPGWTKQSVSAFGAGNNYAAGTTFTRYQTGGTDWTGWYTEWNSVSLKRPIGQSYHHIGNNVNISADNMPGNSTTFAYNIGPYPSGAPMNGPLVSLGGFDGSYDLQLNSDYGSATELYFRTRNGDIPAWNGWRRIWNSNNFNPDNYLALTGGNISGNVAIGTTANQRNLDVNGFLKTRKVTVTQTNWADYVFDTSYRLIPLQQVEQFIQTNKHLPEVPSATDIKENGLDVGANQAILLKKIEELTLYIIQQNKEIIEQNKKIEAQDQRLKELEAKSNFPQP